MDRTFERSWYDPAMAVYPRWLRFRSRPLLNQWKAF